MKKLILSVLVASAVLTSCDKKKEKKPDPVKDPVSFEVPQTYKFERDGKSTVSYTGQTNRLAMANEIGKAFGDLENITPDKLKEMYAHQEGRNDFDGQADLNAAKQNVKSKVAASKAYFSTNSAESLYYKNKFEEYMEGQAGTVKSNKDNVATAGNAGQIADGSKTRYVNEGGLEYDQAFKKGLMGAMIADQILNHYLSKEVLDEGDNRKNNTEKVNESGKDYTTMEHKWDEAYGYLFGAPGVDQENPLNLEGDQAKKTYTFLTKYLVSIGRADGPYKGIDQQVYDAFKKGRAAIVANDYDARDNQVAIIREKLSVIFAVRAIHYLKEGKAKIAANKTTESFHALSEAFGFIFSIRFTQKPGTGAPYMDKDVVEGLLAGLWNNQGFWGLQPDKIDETITAIATAYAIDASTIN